MKKTAIALLILLVIAAGCAKKKVLDDVPPSLFDTGMQYHENRQWGKAIDAFQKYIFSYPASANTEKAQFYLGDSYFQSRDWTQAIIEFEYFLKNYRNLALREEASYKLGKAYFSVSPGYQFDQQVTTSAISVLGKFMLEFPESQYLAEADSLNRILLSRLEEKKVHTGHFYMNSKEYTSAEQYLQDVTVSNLKDDMRDWYFLLYGITEEKLGKYDEALKILDLVRKDSKYYNDAQGLAEKIQK